jgi:hypothetical protein
VVVQKLASYSLAFLLFLFDFGVFDRLVLFFLAGVAFFAERFLGFFFWALSR